MPSDHPVNSPLFTNLLVRRLMDEAADKPELAHAVPGTLLRHSDAGSCGRKLGLRIAGYEVSDPMDAADLWVTFIGHTIHEALQEIIAEIYGPFATIEAKVSWEDLSASGHLDALVDIPRQNVAEVVSPLPAKAFRHTDFYRICLELKTMGGFGFDKSVGLNRKAYALNPKGPEGPRSSAKIQGALNALAADADELRIGHISLEAVSKQLAEKVNWGEEQRILAEWSYPREVFEPWAIAEKARMATILATVADGKLPGRWAVGDDMKLMPLDPQAQRPDWRCSYCSYQELCIQTGKGEPALPKAEVSA
jgi:hypothetical protein